MDDVLQFMADPIIQQMMMLDCAFYGIGVAYILGGMFSRDKSNLLDVYCPCISQNYVQRYLRANGAEKHGQDGFITSTYVTYSIKNYIMQIHFDNRPMSAIITRSLVDVGNFYINRMGIFTQSQIEEGLPYFTLMQRCKQKVCSLNTRSLMSSNVYEVIKELRDNNWTIENTTLKIIQWSEHSEPFQCPICHGHFLNNSTCVETSCRHKFCNECWKNFWDNSVQKRTGIFQFNLEHDPNIITCPMCRNESKSWQCVPYD